MADAARIDVHQHIIPPEFVDALTKHGMGAWLFRDWSPDAAVAMMDEMQIAAGLLSLSAPGLHFGDDAEARDLARAINERTAGVVSARPDRFGMFASLPLPDIDGSLEAVRHAYDDLHADGVIILANSRGVYVGDPSFDPVMEELNKREAVILIHPSALPGPPSPGINPGIADFLLDTVRAAINMANMGIPRRFPKLRIILAHGGGFLPFAVHRIAMSCGLLKPDTPTEQFFEDFSSFYFDTALTSTPTALPSLLAFARPDRVMFGSDWPYAQTPHVKYFADHLDEYGGFDNAGRQAIARDNALRLFPRFAK